MKFHTDEHVSDAVSSGLRRRGLDVTTTIQVGLTGATDQQQLAYCRQEGRVMVSHDADMLRLVAAGIPNAGLAYCHNQKYKPGQILSRLMALSARVIETEMHNRIEFKNLQRSLQTFGQSLRLVQTI